MSASQAECRGFESRLPLHFAMYHVYILYSKQLARHYTGFTRHERKRKKQHDAGRSRWTSRADEWEKVFSKEVATRDEALMLEKRIKRRGASRFLKNFRSE